MQYFHDAETALSGRNLARLQFDGVGILSVCAMILCTSSFALFRPCVWLRFPGHSRFSSQSPRDCKTPCGLAAVNGPASVHGAMPFPGTNLGSKQGTFQGRFGRCVDDGKFCKILQIFGGLVLGCIKTKFCNKICV